MVNKKKRLLLITAWIVTNLLGVFTATLIVFVLYATLHINRYSYSQDWLELIKGIAICGATQGLIIASFQSIVLLLAKIPLMKWWFANILGMILGMILPILYGIAIAKSTDEYIVPSWILSWILSGILSVFATFETKKNRLRGAIIHSIAYLCWGLSLIIGLIFLGAYLDRPEAGTFIIGIFLMASIFIIGAWLDSYVFLMLYDLKKRNSN